MIWVRRINAPAEWNEVQDQFESLFVKLGCPGQMMLVATTGPGPIMLFASLPNPSLLYALAGFERIEDSELPSEASLLVGHPQAFEKRFTYPKWKPPT
ncbi:hypothetical protein [Microvirga aerophila]|uniref:Uncharacterized protein n=1 Tax=Microvirga aerophila TaxID=670291 RepID=A0A512BWY7_9HYPH|nr:hypothetical protein [Microvirga aerophila]GEO16470.1 hypothetical protein MAE02_41660 [Microvirga aerophila]